MKMITVFCTCCYTLLLSACGGGVSTKTNQPTNTTISSTTTTSSSATTSSSSITSQNSSRSNSSTSVSSSSQAGNTQFKLTSSLFTENGTLPADYTCDGVGSSPALNWTNIPNGTKSLVLTMTTVPTDGITKWNWIVYNIPVNTTELSRDSLGVGLLGQGSDGPFVGYQPPCSQGPGAKTYTFTLYALSETPRFDTTPVNGTTLNSAIAPITLAETKLNATYTRTNLGSSTECTNVRNAINGSTTGTAIVNCDADFAYVGSTGLANHTMMDGITATNLQVPIAQKFIGQNAWKIPLKPSIATNTTSAIDGPIGIAINGVPIFNPCKQGGCQNGDTKVLGELDVCNGHAGRADDYHYHAAPTCLISTKPSSYWDTHPIGWALDGFAIFGYNNPDGNLADRDSICGGNSSPASTANGSYAYHVSDKSPYVLSCFRGTPSSDLANQAQKYQPIRKPPVTPFSVFNMTLTTDSVDNSKTLQFSTAKDFTTTSDGTDSHTNQAGSYKIRYKNLTGTELTNSLALTENKGKVQCWEFQFLDNSNTTTQPSKIYCR